MDKRVIRFDGWLVDFESGEISKDGATTRLQDQPLAVLDELTRRPGEVVTREQLIARLWPTGVVEYDTGLNTAVRKLRNALGDGADTPRYIETLPRKGYRFIASLEAMRATEPTPHRAAQVAESAPRYDVAPEAPPAPTQTRAPDRGSSLRRLALGLGSLLAAGVLAVIAWRMPGAWLSENDHVGEAPPTIVVLPLVDMSLDQKEQYLCDGLTDELSNWLAHIPTLRVVARTSAFAFKGENKDVREIAKALDATHVLEGSLRRSGENLRVTVQLIEAKRGVHIWSDTYALPIGDIFLIEDTVSRSVAEALHLKLAADTAEAWAQRQPRKMEAYELYLLGRARERDRTATDNLKAIEYYRRAIAADPDYALALTALSGALLNSRTLNNRPLEDIVIEAEPLLNRALELEPSLADAHAVKGWLLSDQLHFDQAQAALEQSIRINPNDARSHRVLGDLYGNRGNPTKALEHFTTAARLDPLDFLSQVLRCLELTDLGDYPEAGRACARGRELDPANLWGPLATAWIERAQGNTAEAIRWIDEARRLSPANPTLANQKVDLLLSLGKVAEARAAAEDAPADGSFDFFSRGGRLVYAEKGPKALREWIAANALQAKATTSAELRELAHLQWMAGDPLAARGTLEHADRILPATLVDRLDGGQIRHAASAVLVRAGVELESQGDVARANKLLDDLDGLLDKFERNGGRHYGLYSLRAESLALRGKKAEAQAAIDEAWRRGWRSAWTLRTEPWFAGIKVPEAKAL